MREVASRRQGEGPPPGERPEAGPEAAARAAGAGGKVSTREFLFNFYSSRNDNGYCNTDKIKEKPNRK